jgi:hypothetical protein
MPASAGGGGGLAFVTGAAHQCTVGQATGSSSIACTVTGANAGDTFVIVINDTYAPSSVTDSSGGTIATGVTYSSAMSVYWESNVAAGSHTITANGVYFVDQMSVYEYARSTASLSGNYAGNNNTFTPAVCTGLTTVTTGSFAVAAWVNPAPTPALTPGTPTNSFVIRGQNTLPGTTGGNIVVGDNLPTGNGASGSSISTSISYSPSTGFNRCILLEMQP